MKRKTEIKLLIILIIAILLFPFTQGRWKLSKGVTVENIRKLKYGMPEKEVIKLLGKPFYVSKMYKMGFYTFKYKRPFFEGELNKKKISGEYTMHFSKYVIFAGWYPMLWVNFKNNRHF